MGKTIPQFASFSQFYPFYLGEQTDRNCRRLHFACISLVIATVVYAPLSWNYATLWLGNVQL